MKNLLFLPIALLLAAACSPQPPDRPDTGADPGTVPQTAPAITGVVLYRERVALSSHARLEVTLEDVSRQDVAATAVAQVVMEDPGQVPIRFELSYPPDAIDPGHSYALRLRILEQDQLRFINDTRIPVLTRGAGKEVRATLVQVGGWQPETRSAPTPTGAGMPLRGMFRYMADAARFVDCRTNKSFPVAMEGAYIEVERAYLNSGIEGGSPVLIEISGRYLERPAMEGNRNEVNLIIDTFHNLLPDETCSPSTHAELIGTYWRLTEVDGQAVTTGSGQRERHMILDAAESRVRGYAGCNNFFGAFEPGSGTGDGALRFDGVGSTMMACPQGMEIEQAFLQALGQTTRYEIAGLILTLYAEDHPLARFEAVYL